MKSSNVERAEELFRVAAEVATENGRLWRSWATSQLDKDPNSALHTVTNGLKFVSKPVELVGLLVIRGRALAAMKRYSEAERAYREALNISEINAETHYYYATTVLEPENRIHDACAQLKKAQIAHSVRFRRDIERAINRLGC